MYTLYYATETVDEGGPTGLWEVRRESYVNIADVDPIEGSDELVSRNHTEASAHDMAGARQRSSYSENRRRDNAAQD